jgi:hypothetical protein
MALYGAPDQEIAEAIGISARTLRWWRQQHIEFSAGTRVTDEQMAEGARSSLYRRAMGFTHTVRVERLVRGKKVTLKVSEYYPPDTNAAFKILQAYDKQQAFREKTEVKSTFSWANLIAETDRYLESKKATVIEGTAEPTDDVS